MKISFVIPAYNEERIITRCLESIKRALSEGTYDAEIIVVNNASTDRTKEVVSRMEGVHVVDEPRKGLTRARQAGYAASSGDIIANVDADTMLTPEWLPTVMKEFSENPKLVALSGPFIYYDLPLFIRVLVKIFYAFGYFFYFLNQRILHAGAMLQGGNFIVRRTALEKIGGYDTSIAFYGEDTDVATRISKIGLVKWTFRLPMFASGRRLQKEGFVTMGVKYAVNFFWTTYKGVPFTKEYTDVRVK
ncbi:MAG: glycosyltransferase family 2 protein [Candidatus Kaiserbacteria bacterium]|nr:glycosyltransferase family 2 protein [Candidatus Kaiserbacteria bacterium]